MSAIQRELENDHRRLEALFRAALLPDGTIEPESYRAFRAGLLRHIGIEEKILFARVRERLGEPLPVFRQLRIEHGALASLLVPTPDHALMHEIRTILEPHDALEEGETGVYARCLEVLGDDPAILAAIRAFPEPPLNAHYDGPRAIRTAQEALASSAKQNFR